MFNTLKKKISNGCYATNVAITLIVVIAGVLMWHKMTQASIDSFTFVPAVSGTDNVVGTEGKYTIAYTAIDNTYLNQIYLKLPSIFTVAGPPIHNPAAMIRSGNDTPGNISINGLDFEVGGVDYTGDTITVTLVTPYDPTSYSIQSDVEFTILLGITNTTTPGTVSPSGFTPVGGVEDPWTGLNTLTIDDDMSDSSPRTLDNSFDIIPGPAFTLDFTTLPSMSPAPAAGDVQSATQWDVQPVVTAHDRYGNVATSYDGDKVALGLASGDGVFTIATAFDFCSAPAGTFIAQAVAGVIDFNNAMASYIATVDHEQFTLSAAHTCGSNGGSIGSDGVSTAITADVVASEFVWTVEPANCTSGLACSTQGSITAQDTAVDGLTTYTATDLDFAEEVTLGTDGAGTFLGDTLQSAWVNGILATVGLGYTLVDPAVPEEVFFFVEAPRIAQYFTTGTTVAVAPVTPPPPPPPPSNPSGAGVYNPNPDEIPEQGIAVAPTIPTTIGGITPAPSSGSGVSSDGGCVPYLTTYMRFGDRGDQVARLQTFLFRQGSYVEGFITGYFGKLTERAVNAFQIRYGADILVPQNLLGPTGYAKDYTISAINKLLCSGAVTL